MYEKEELSATTMTLPFPLPGDLPEFDYFLSQYIHSLIKAGQDGRDPGQWFGRLIGYSPAAAKYVFQMNGVYYSMEHIINLVQNKDVAFRFMSVDPITAANYTRNGNEVNANVGATFELTDNRLPNSPRMTFTVTFTHILKPTFQAFSTIIR